MLFVTLEKYQNKKKQSFMYAKPSHNAINTFYQDTIKDQLDIR